MADCSIGLLRGLAAGCVKRVLVLLAEAGPVVLLNKFDPKSELLGVAGFAAV